MVGLTGRQCMSLSGRESGRPLVGLVLTPPLDASEWMEANLTCMCVWPSFHSSALLGMSSTPPHIRDVRKKKKKSTRHKPPRNQNNEQGQVTSGSFSHIHQVQLSLLTGGRTQLYPHHQQYFLIATDIYRSTWPWPILKHGNLDLQRLKRGTCM